jgi:hypothetical protein
MTNVRRNIKCEYTSVVEQILTFKTFKGFKNQVAFGAVNN